MKYVLALFLGFFLHLTLFELGNLSYEYRWTNCVLRMHKKEVPKKHPKGGHYCLKYMEELTLFEKISRYNFGLWQIYAEKIGRPKLRKANEKYSKGK